VARKTTMTTQDVNELYARLEPKLRRHVAKNVYRDAVDDVVQDTMIKVVSGFRRWHGLIGEEAYCAMVANGCIVDAQRKHAARERVETPAGGLTELAEQSELGGYALPSIEDARFAADFDRAVRAMGTEVRTAFILTELRGIDNDEAAELMGVVERTIERYRAEARTQLKEAL